MDFNKNGFYFSDGESDFSQLLESNMQDPNLVIPENVEYAENLPQSSEISAERMEDAQGVYGEFPT